MKSTVTKIICAVLSIVLLSAMFVSCGNAAQTTSAPETSVTETTVDTTAETAAETTAAATLIGEGQFSFAFTATFADGTQRVYTVSTDKETVGDALLSEGLIEGDKSEYGIYVKSVCGVTADYDADKTYWALYTDGEMSMVGVDSVKCADVASVEFKVEK